MASLLPLLFSWTTSGVEGVLALPFLLAEEQSSWLRVHGAALAFCLLLVTASLWMFRVQRKAASELVSFAGSPREHLYLRRRVRRRTQVAGMFLLMGVMILVGDWIPWTKAPITFALYWMIVLLLALWTVLLAMGDIVATRVYLDSELRQLRAKLELEQQAHDLRTAPPRRPTDRDD